MSCNTCSKEFGLLTKELGCPNCGFSFCSKCLKYSIVVPKLGKTKKVCSRCYDGLTKLANKPKSAETEEPEALKKRMDALSAKGSGSRPLERGDGSLPVEEIEKRLERLRQDSKEIIPPHMEIEERLAKLKGVDVSYYRQTPITVYTQKRAEKASDLLKQAADEVRIEAERRESINRSIREIEQRLSALHETHPSSEPKGNETTESTRQNATAIEELPCGTEDEDMDEVHQLIEREMKAAKQEIEDLKRDRELMTELSKMSVKSKVGKVQDTKDHDSDEGIEEEEADAVLQQVLAESAAEDQEMEEMVSSPQNKEELPWCVICNDDAALRCHDCTDDLYCRRCFKEYHSSEAHRASPFKA